MWRVQKDIQVYQHYQLLCRCNCTCFALLIAGCLATKVTFYDNEAQGNLPNKRATRYVNITGYVQRWPCFNVPTTGFINNPAKTALTKITANVYNLIKIKETEGEGRVTEKYLMYHKDTIPNHLGCDQNIGKCTINLRCFFQ